uniref:Uncharacterized protein n=1 Tax=Ciona intestinalis TaxID=7719 RepID=H2XWC5_CIOIN
MTSHNNIMTSHTWKLSPLFNLVDCHSGESIISLSLMSWRNMPRIHQFHLRARYQGTTDYITYVPDTSIETLASTVVLPSTAYLSPGNIWTHLQFWWTRALNSCLVTANVWNT